MKSFVAVYSLLLAGGLAACSSDPSTSSTPAGAGGSNTDAATVDGTVSEDAAPESASPPEAGPEAALPDAGPDASQDAQTEDVAADGAAPEDGATEAEAPDSGGPTGVNVIANPGFEFWSDGLPDAWKGVTSNITDESIIDSTSVPHGGEHSCRLVNSSTTHKRFSTATFALARGHYDCTYWARGGGEVRNAFHDGADYSSYSGYTTVTGTDWKQIAYSFNLAADTDAFELIFSVRSTDITVGDLELDDVYCARRAEPCDAVTCPDWAECSPSTVACEPLYGRCADAGDCLSWETCDASNTCIVAPGNCNSTADCDLASATPVCDKPSHTCVAGDPCYGVTCDEWKHCDPNTALCVLSDGRCNTTADCLADLPACDGTAHTCVGVDSPVNIVPNGGFESWGVYDIPYLGQHLIPDSWYGLDIPGSSEIDPARVLQYSTAPHSGTLAVQLIQDGIAERFTSDLFDVAAGNYTCAYWVRGKGSIRHRTYSSGGWSPYTDREEIDSLEWSQKRFIINSAVHDMRIIFYASYTDAAKDHIQVDDVVCTRDP